jgi:hypothetical protein
VPPDAGGARPNTGRAYVNPGRAVTGVVVLMEDQPIIGTLGRVAGEAVDISLLAAALHLWRGMSRAHIKEFGDMRRHRGTSGMVESGVRLAGRDGWEGH